MSKRAALLACLSASLIAPLDAKAADNVCLVEKVVLREKSGSGDAPTLAVTAFSWASGFSITRADGSQISQHPVRVMKKYHEETQERVRAGLQPLAVPEGRYLILAEGDVARASTMHRSCSFTARRVNGQLSLELEANFCERGQCERARELVTPEAAEP